MAPDLGAAVNGIGLGRFPGTKEGVSEMMRLLSGRATTAVWPTR
jgi:hypothetical protein